MTRKLAIVVTGGRNYANAELVNAALDVCRPDLVLHGDATGADQLAERWCNDTETPYVAYPAQWNIHERAAGPIRNGHMCDDLLKYRHDGYRIGVVAFPGNAGTANCVNCADERGIPVWYPARSTSPDWNASTVKRVARKVQLSLA